MRLLDTIGLAVLAALGATPAAGQHHVTNASATGADFLNRAREATARYHDQARAIADGFRPVGPDAPAMGQHWVHPGRVLGSLFDAAQPAGLTYIMLGDRPTLTGVIYVLLLDQEVQAPEEPAGADSWHFHNGELSDEALLSTHDPVRGRDRTGLRIAVLHAWLWAENPDGPFAAENWLLPYRRLGLAPRHATPRSAKAVSLATTEGRSFVASRVRLATPHAVPDVDPVLLAAGERIRARLTEPRAAELTDADIRWLEESWQAVVRDLVALAAPNERRRIRELLDPGAP